MSLGSYNELLAEVANWLHRSNLTAKIPTFVKLAETTINRRLVSASREVEAPLATEVGSRFVALPADFGSPLALTSDYVEPRYQFTMKTPEQLPVNDEQTGIPRFWAIDGENIAFECVPDAIYPLQFRYLQSLNLSSVSQTNDTFARYPELYLFGALANAAPFVRDDKSIALWKNEFNTRLLEAAAEASRNRGMAPLQTDIPAMMTNGRLTRCQ